MAVNRPAVNPTVDAVERPHGGAVVSVDLGGGHRAGGEPRAAGERAGEVTEVVSVVFEAVASRRANVVVSMASTLREPVPARRWGTLLSCR